MQVFDDRNILDIQHDHHSIHENRKVSKNDVIQIAYDTIRTGNREMSLNSIVIDILPFDSHSYNFILFVNFWGIMHTVTFIRDSPK